ncbi:NADH-quinone oxidoreductase subunit NuoB [Azotosporobacter soli]|uniref:NADH-quinone oxidoreductase subunit NuoB n=1 Tax=Azotosporobacter soli TaxID=3055040 RepID=UPI0031FF21AA
MMLRMLKQILHTGLATEAYADEEASVGLRGELVIEAQGCDGCGNCALNCPTGALEAKRKRLKWERKKCLFCGLCVTQCQRCLSQTQNVALAELGLRLEGEAGILLRKRISNVLGRSLHVRHLDAGSCNACDFEMSALGSPIYDLQQYGIDFVASPRHADLLMVTGVVTKNLLEAIKMTYEATPEPRLVMAVGACACSGKVFPKGYAVVGALDDVLPVDIYVPGCPPSPSALLQGLFMLLGKF